ncbi:hypothetical protein, partial [Aeromonas enteropelogenes]|uniref:hypothetical protein n=1 Tax=Aeromonas enteropelogenes TaxID=29489 RepID=UPI001C87C170
LFAELPEKSCHSIALSCDDSLSFSPFASGYPYPLSIWPADHTKQRGGLLAASLRCPMTYQPGC